MEHPGRNVGLAGFGRHQAPGRATGKMLFDLSLTGEMQRKAQANAFNARSELTRINAVAFTQRGSDVITPLLSVVACWMMLNIAGWNLFAPANRMVMAVNVVCAK
jgi:hypothetical protein